MYNNNNQENYHERQFNMALAYLEGFDNLLRLRDESAINKDIEKWRRIMLAIYTRFDFYFTNNEKTSIDDKFNIINIRCVNYARAPPSAQLVEFPVIEKLLDELTKEMLRILHKNEIIFPIMHKSEGWTKEIENDF